jgi:hypothetical protein
MDTSANATEAKSSADSPVFIVGLSRAGTTLLSRMLDAHSEIAIFPETWMYVVLDRLGCLKEFRNPWQTALFFDEVWKNLISYRDPAARVVALEAARETGYLGPSARLLEQLGRAYARERNAKIWGEKTPGHALWLPQIRALFPQARILFMVRDPRDVLVSYDERWDEGRRDTKYIANTAALLKYYLSHLLRRSAFPPEQIHWVRYETLAANPAAELQRVCNFLGVDFQESMLTFYRRYTNVEQEMPDGKYHALLGRPVTTGKIGRYREALTQTQIALVENLLGEEMQAVGYSPSNSHAASFTHIEKRALSEAEEHYREMVSGQIRRRFRRTGKLKVRTYQIFGRALGIVPSWRVAVSESDWRRRC